MAQYRYQVVSVGMWRGQIKRWNTTFWYSSPSSVAGVYTRMQASGWMNPGDVTGACSGGVASIAVYNAAGGVPISNTIYFDWKTPSTWIPYTATYWASIAPTTLLDAAGESALVLVGNLPGLSVTGKPRSTRKYLHAVPSRTAAAFGDPDVPAAVVTAFQNGWGTVYMGNKAGQVPGSVSVNEWYGNHQRVRGRRKPVAQTAANAFTLGVLAGGGATTSGQGEPFPGGEF